MTPLPSIKELTRYKQLDMMHDFVEDGWILILADDWVFRSLEELYPSSPSVDEWYKKFIVNTRYGPMFVGLLRPCIRLMAWLAKYMSWRRWDEPPVFIVDLTCPEGRYLAGFSPGQRISKVCPKTERGRWESVCNWIMYLSQQHPGAFISEIITPHYDMVERELEQLKEQRERADYGAR